MLLSNYIVIKSSTSNYSIITLSLSNLSKIKPHEMTLSGKQILLVELQWTLPGQSQTFSWSFQRVPGPQEVR